MKIGFVFPGQGSQTIGMGKDIYEKYEQARKVYDKVKEITGIDVAKITFDGTQEELNQTKNTQICILTMSLAILEILKEQNIEADITAGLSLGEYTSLIYSGILNFEDGVKIVQKRGQFMQEMLPKGEWSMAAVLGLEDKKIEEVCKQVTSGFVIPANYNCVGQVAISGEKQAVQDAMPLLKEAGAKKVVELKTSGPFHTNKLTEAANALENELENVQINSSTKTVIKNIDGTPYEENDNIREILKNHIISPVQFSKSINTMINLGVDTFIEIGPSKTLSGFIKRNSRDVKILNINDVNTLEQTISYFN